MSVTPGPSGLVYVLVRLPDGRARRLSITRDMATVSNVQFLAGALAVLVAMET